MNQQKIQSLWAHLHCLTVLQQQGSFTAAAKHLGISKATVSQRISELEKVAGVPLVHRTTRSVQLSEAGRQLAENSHNAFTTIAQSFASVQDMAELPRGTLRVTAPVAFARQQVVPRMQTFMESYPDIRIELDLSDRLLSLEKEGFDLAIRHVTTPPDIYVVRPLCRTRSLLVASPGYLAKHGVPQHPEDLLTHRCLNYPRPHGTVTWSFEKKVIGEKTLRLTVPIARSFSANNSEVLRDIAIQNQGIALTPDFSVQQAIQDGLLCEVLPEWKSISTFGEHIYAMRPYAPQLPLAVRLFVDYLHDIFEKGFMPFPK